MKYESWKYNLDFIDKNTLKIEEEEEDLKMYTYFSTLRWKNCIAIVYKDIILCEYEDDIPYDDWYMAVNMLTILKIEHGESKKKFVESNSHYYIKDDN